MISCVILTKDEEADLPRCLASLTWCSDIHILDSGSTDATLELAVAAGAHVTTRAPDGPFIIAEQRNWALAELPLANDWVLFVDADEVLPTEFVEAILAAVATDDHPAYWCAPKFIYHGDWLRYTKGFPNWHSRLMRREVRLVGGVWESFPADMDAGYIDQPYLHHANSKGLTAWVEKNTRYALWEGISPGVTDHTPKGAKHIGLRRLARAIGPFRPWGVLFGTLLLRRGFADGQAGFSYLRRIMIYELLVQEAMTEESVLRRGGTL